MRSDVIGLAKRLLEVAEAIDFDPAVRAAVEVDPRAVLGTAGVPPEMVEQLVVTDDVVGFASRARVIAKRLHDLAMGLLRQEGIVRPVLTADAAPVPRG